MSVVVAYNPSHREHRSAGHVERPGRLDAVMNRLEKHPTWGRAERIKTPPADPDSLYLVHSTEHVRSVQDAIRSGRYHLDPDTYVTGSSFRTALDALGCLLGVVDTVLEDRADSGFAAIRPPGHHATPDRSMGFCLFSNVAIAARWAQSQHGVGRILILDFDVHHGNGTQDVFYDDPDVFYMSVHQSPLYPGTGALEERGTGDGEGTTLNIPLPSGSGDAAYLRVFREILRPIALQFSPEVIFISAGYDAHWMDLLGGMRLSTAGYAKLVREMIEWADVCCDGRVIAALEGGYHTEALAHSVAATVDVLSDPDCRILDPIGPPPGQDLDVDPYIDKLRSAFDL